MKNIKILLPIGLLLCLLIVSVIACEKHPPEGDLTFSCKINGKLFISDKGCVDDFRIMRSTKFFRSANDSNLCVRAVRCSGGGFFITLRDYKIGINSVGLSNGISECDGFKYTNTSAILYKDGKTYLSRENSGAITILEKTLTQVKGTFSFILYNVNDANDVVKITNGKFDD